MKVLIVRVGAMGDVLHTLPAVAALHRAQPTWQIDWVVDPRWQSLLTDPTDDTGPIIHRVHLANTQLWKQHPLSPATLRSLLTLRRNLRAARYDLVIDMQGTLRSAIIGRWAASNHAYIGHATPREPLAAPLYQSKIPRRGTHIVTQNTNLLAEATGLPLTPIPVDLPRIATAEHWAEHDAVLRRPLALIAPGGGWASKQWPAQKFGELARELHHLGYDVLINSAHANDELAQLVLHASQNTARPILSDIPGLVALLRRTDLVIGNDSGPTHLAATLAVPTVALFGPTDPARNGPFGPGPLAILRDPASPTSYKRTQTPDPGLTHLSVATVLEAIRKLVTLPPR